MSFPLAPVNGQQAIIGNVAYQFNSSKSAWFRLTGLYDHLTISGNLTVGNVLADHFIFANGTPFTTSSYGDANVAAYLTGNVTVGNVAATGYYFANGTPFVSSSYGNTDVGAYLLIDSTITGLQANAAFQANLIDVLTGNAASQGSVLDVLVANAAVQSANLTSLLSNAAAQEASLTSLVSNAATQSTAIDTINANVGAYQIYANATFTTYSNTNVASYLAGNVTTGNVSATGYYFANGTPFVSSSYGNIEVASYLPTYTGNLNPGNVTASGNIVGGGVRTTTGSVKPSTPTPGDMWYDTTIDTLFRYTDLGTDRRWIDITGMTFEIKAATIYGNTNVAAYLAGNVTTGNISSAGYYFANGTPFVSSTYGNTNVAAYLAGNVTTGNISSTGYYFANGTPFVSSTYGNTEVAAYLTGNTTIGNVSASGYYFANGAPFSGGGGTNSVAAGYAMIFGGF